MERGRAQANRTRGTLVGTVSKLSPERTTESKKISKLTVPKRIEKEHRELKSGQGSGQSMEDRRGGEQWGSSDESILVRD